MAPCSSPMWPRGSCSLRSWAGAAPKPRPRIFSLWSSAIPKFPARTPPRGWSARPAGARGRANGLTGGRRWSLRLRNGLDVRLPETEVASALERLVALDGDAKLISRDIVLIDLRLKDRVTVRLSPAAAQSRADALKDKKPPAKKGGAA